jgi:hypothetical protein
MKNIFYIPCLIIMALAYTMLSEILAGDYNNSSKLELREPAALKIDKQVDCVDLPVKFNQNSVSRQCN